MSDNQCGLSGAVQLISDRWSFLIIYAAFYDVRNFDEFGRFLGIARNVLSSRLSKLVDHGIMRREHCQKDRRKVKYQLTHKGVDLLPALVALRQWGERYGTSLSHGKTLVDCRTRQPIRPIEIRSHDGRPLIWLDVTWSKVTSRGER